MSNMRRCPDGGGPFPEDIYDGLCPRCVTRVALASPPEEGPSVSPQVDFAVSSGSGNARRCGDYELLEQLGCGGTGVVYKSLAELNQLDIDTRSDIYSLGVLRYELLTG